MLHETCYLDKFVVVVLARVEHLEVFESLLLQGYQYACNNLFPFYSLRLQAVWHHVIDVLNEDNVGVNLVEVLYQRTVTTRTEQERAILVAEWSAVWVSSYCIGRRLLLRETDVILHTILLGITVSLGSYLSLEEIEMLVRNSEVYVSLAI